MMSRGITGESGRFLQRDGVHWGTRKTLAERLGIFDACAIEHYQYGVTAIATRTPRGGVFIDACSGLGGLATCGIVAGLALVVLVSPLGYPRHSAAAIDDSATGIALVSAAGVAAGIPPAGDDVA